MKKAYVILSFHAHEPLWDLPKAMRENVEDVDIKQTLGDENWIRRRSAEGRDIYADLISFAQATGFKVSLEATNELLAQLSHAVPETFERLIAAYKSGLIYPLYGHAHHTHISLLNDTEVRDEIRLNREFVHDVMGAPKPQFAGLFPIEDSIDSAKLQGIKDAGIDFVIFPSLDRRKCRFRADAGLDTRHQPFLIGPDIIALPRHFAVSQYIWRPITKWKVAGLKPQGYLVGRYWVLPEEYRRRHSVRFPIGRTEAIRQYTAVLNRALEAAPDGGLILYMQDLELMDFGDVALDVMQEAWKTALKTAPADVSFVTPDEYLQLAVPKAAELKRVRFHQVSWAPEIRLVLRYDGHYPPLGAGPYRGTDADRQIFRRLPFVFWEPGRYIVQLVNALMDMFGVAPSLGVTAADLQAHNYRFDKLTIDDRLRLHSRIIKRACNWGWFPAEGLQKQPFLNGYIIADLLLQRLTEDPHLKRAPVLPPVSTLRGLERLLEIIIDTRHSYLSQATSELGLEAGQPLEDAERELKRAMEWREEARRAVLRARYYASRLSAAAVDGQAQELSQLLSAFRAYCRAVFVSLDRLQRAWVRAGNTERVLLTMYDYLFELYPPKFPAILESTLTEDEIKALEHPVLR